MVEAVAQADASQKLVRAGSGIGDRNPGDAHRHLRIFQGGELGQEVVELEHEADMPVSERHQPVA